MSDNLYPIGPIPGGAPCIECDHTLNDHNGAGCDLCTCLGYSAPWDAFDYSV